MKYMIQSKYVQKAKNKKHNNNKFLVRVFLI